jgi:hypothetical protein
LLAWFMTAARSEGARADGGGLQTFRDWVLRFIAAGPDAAVHGVVRWRLSDLAEWVMERYGASISGPTLSRYLRAMGYRRLSARPRHHAQNPDAVNWLVRPANGPGCSEIS